MSDAEQREERQSDPDLLGRDESSFAHYLADIWDEEIEPLYARHHWELLLENLELPPRPQVLVAGCSTGAIIPELLRRMSSAEQGRVIALEARGPLLAKARSRVADYDRRRVFLRGESMRKLRFAAGVFDVVVSSLSWLELPEPGVALREFFRVLKPGGKVALSLPLRGSLQEVYDLFAEVTLKFELPEVHRNLEELYHGKHPEPQDAEGLLGGVGFQEVTLRTHEHMMSLPAEADFFQAALVRGLFEREWRAAAGDKADLLFQQTQASIATYFGSEPFQVRLVTGCLGGVKPRGIASR